MAISTVVTQNSTVLVCSLHQVRFTTILSDGELEE
jgi:hypothetical protein